MKINAKLTLTPLVWARLLIMTVTSFILIGLLFFLYRDFYQTIVQAETVIVLKREVALRDIELDLFQRVRAVNDFKIKNILPERIVDAFGTSPAPTPPSALTTNAAGS